MTESFVENFSKHPCRTEELLTAASLTNVTRRSEWSTHLHHGVPGAVVSQLLQPGGEALAGLTVDAARLHHGVALLH